MKLWIASFLVVFLCANLPAEEDPIEPPLDSACVVEEEMNSADWEIANPLEGICLAAGALACNSQWSLCNCVACPAYVLSLGLPRCSILNTYVCRNRCNLERERCLVTASIECTGAPGAYGVLAGPAATIGRTTYYTATSPECLP